MRGVPVTIVAVGNYYVLHILGMWLQP